MYDTSKIGLNKVSMNKKIMKALIAGLITATAISLDGQSHYGDRYEWGKIYSEKERLKDEIDNLHTQNELDEWQKYRCHYSYCEDDAQNDVRKIPSQPGYLHIHEQCRNNAWVPVIRDRGYWVEVIQKNGGWISVEKPEQEIERKQTE
jgi:hypothetical protein